MGARTTHEDGLTTSDPRPRTVERDGQVLLRGRRCPTCGLARAARAPHCPECRDPLEVAEFGPSGTVRSSTVVHLEIDDIVAPYGLADVDLDDGPRCLAHTTDATSPLAVGARVAITGTTPRGDLQVAPVAGEGAR